jgi:hypothetical protein
MDGNLQRNLAINMAPSNPYTICSPPLRGRAHVLPFGFEKLDSPDPPCGRDFFVHRLEEPIALRDVRRCGNGLVHGRHSIRDDFAKLNYRLTKRHMLLDLAMKPITVIVQLLAHTLKARNEVVNFMNRATRYLRDQRGQILRRPLDRIRLSGFSTSQYVPHIEFNCCHSLC